MPFSSKEGKDIIKHWINDINYPFNRILDLGVGKGTYHKLFTKNYTKLTNSYWIGIEVWSPYIEKYNLLKKYNKIINSDIRKVDYNTLNPIDLTFAGDVLEHVSKEEAISVVNSVMNVCPYLIISIPIIHYPQEEIENNPYEVHVKDDWSNKEMLETFPQIVKSWTGREIGCYLLSST